MGFHNDYVTPSNFGHLLLKGNSELIYKQCVKDFQRLIAIEQFTEMISKFNENVKMNRRKL